MRFTGNKIVEINKEYRDLQFASKKRAFCFGLAFTQGRIESNTTCSSICRVEDLEDLIEELTMMKQAIENTTGLILGE